MSQVDQWQEEYNKALESGEITENDGGDWLKMKEGDNKMRVMAKPALMVSVYKQGICYTGAKYCQDASLTKRWLTWVIDRADGKLKLFGMPYKLGKQLMQMAQSEEYSFDDFPMPYDIIINADDKVGTTDVTYVLSGARSNTDLTTIEKELYEGEETPEEILQKMKDKKMKEDGVAPAGE